MKQTKPSDLCVSVFKSGKRTTTRTEYTKAWIELINQAEKSKQINLGGK